MKYYCKLIYEICGHKFISKMLWLSLLIFTMTATISMIPLLIIHNIIIDQDMSEMYMLSCGIICLITSIIHHIYFYFVGSKLTDNK